MAHFPSTFHPLILASIDVSWLNNYSLIAAKWRSSSIIFPHLLVGILLYGKLSVLPVYFFIGPCFIQWAVTFFCHYLDAQIVSDLARGSPVPWLLYPPDVFPACFEHLLAFWPPSPTWFRLTFCFPCPSPVFPRSPHSFSGEWNLELRLGPGAAHRHERMASPGPPRGQGRGACAL